VPRRHPGIRHGDARAIPLAGLRRSTLLAAPDHRDKHDAQQPPHVALVHAARGETLTNKRARRLAAVDAHAARDVLLRLRDQGFLEQHAQRGGASYRLSGTLRPPAGLQLSPEELADVVAQLADGGPISSSDVRAATGLDRAQALAVLDRLVRERRLARTGQRRGAKYHRP
jgi:hypothetical protein